MNTAGRRAVAALWSIRGVGPMTLHELEKRFGALGELLDKPLATWAPLFEWRTSAAEHVAQVRSLAERADRLERQCKVIGADIVFPGDRAWPDRMDDVGGLPPLLFMHGPGAAAPRRRRVAIVGARSVDPSAERRLFELSAAIAAEGVGVISGAALGCDQAAHRGAMAAGGETWAFLGNALDQIDPPQREICRQLRAAGQTIFSQFPPGARANKSTFTQRNALISAASDAVLVFRAGENSGALHTARDAVAQRRPLLATPADPWNEGALGSNALLQEGARPQVNVEDVLDAVGLTGSLSPREVPKFDANTLTPSARRVYEYLGRGSVDFDSLVAGLSELGAGVVSAALVELEVRGGVQHLGSRRYEKR
ncbi:MAG: DNA-processing protein DprA [Archangium gephyra]|uniref:DNA-processing protein DprA n=1 Tax=Archangium gephyra TaxID=48 RepID=A0A2W5TFG2_9BACT|nr:MAG: DNA-processing protein DprA [Archangium gephyra]